MEMRADTLLLSELFVVVLKMKYEIWSHMSCPTIIKMSLKAFGRVMKCPRGHFELEE